MEAAEPSTPLCRILEPPRDWLNGTHESRVVDFVGPDDEDISTYDTDQCPALTVLAAYYGNRGGHAPAPGVDPHHLVFTETEVEDANGTIADTPAAKAWPPEYDRAHRDITANHAEVADAIVTLCEADPASRVVVTDRVTLLREIFNLAARRAAPEPFVRRVRKRAAKLLRDEPELYLELAEGYQDLCYRFLDADPGHQSQMRKYWRENRALWDRVVVVVPATAQDSRFSTG